MGKPKRQAAREKTSVSQTARAPIMQRPGILVTRSLIELSGRSYAVAQLNAIKVDQVNHPRSAGLVLGTLASLALGGLILLVDLILLGIGDRRQDDFVYLVGGLFVFGVMMLTPAFFCIRTLRRLPPWALLRLELSSGSTKALSDERRQVEAVAAAIRMVMAER